MLDTLYLLGAALLVCLVGAGAFVLADTYHISPLWVFFALISVIFLAGAREDYRKEFRSPQFVAFVVGWLVINVIMVVVVLTFSSWLWLIPSLLFQQFLFYMTAFWFFGVPPPSKLWPFQRPPSDGHNE